ncbi:MAG: glucose-6-phosphate dehydrogenase assembly protein OpcA [Akkermansiaceae bacterium]|jgi:glucose-6-phosphate dehydrogenase assembly protein OpcA|nr:glucose-6-phosphate dehydrogenase assembly protein OpcA [Akkermansiaceae bacterium]MCU0778710.1 glucose-6-phosphate dehydrogenase assembly protein OpcA [Akkermansiaceae bacterium]
MFASAIPDVCPELGLEVPVSQIDRELHRLWEQDEARTNASLMNLAVYSEKPGALLENSAIIRILTREHACRAILVEVNRAESRPGLRAWITAHCHLAHGRKSVCCEQIAFYLTGKVTGRFRNTVFAHLNSDLPLVFWWQGELSDIFAERLVSVMDRLIIDSSTWADPAASFRRIAEESHSNSDLILHDHEWTRTWQFRLGVAGVFDDPAAQQALPDIGRVEITHHPAHRNAALQLLAWLAVQADWKDREAVTGSFTFESPGGRIIEAVLRQNPDAPALSSLVLRAGGRSAHLSQAAGATHVERRIEAPGYQVVSLAPADPASPEQLVALQLARGGKNSLFRKILPRFQQLLDASRQLPA